MADVGEPEDSAHAHAEAALEEAEAEIAEAEALAAAARARARAARIRRQAFAEDADFDESYEYDDEADEVDEVDAEYEPEPEPWALSRLLPFLPIVAKVASVILILAFAGLSAYMAWQHNEAKDRQTRTEAFANGARQGVKYMTTIDFHNAKKDVQRVIDSSTGEFREDFQRRLDDFTKTVEQSKVVTEGTVNAAAVELMEEHSAQVLVSVTSRITNSAGSKDQSQVLRLRVTVTEDGGQYKMSKVEFVP